jgi:hypothetical protein
MVTAGAAAVVIIAGTAGVGAASSDQAPPRTPPAGLILRAGGQLDAGFATGGTLDLPGGESLALDAQQRIWVLGTVVHTGGVRRYLTRLTADGRADATFTGPAETSNAADLTTGPLILDPTGGGASFAVNMCCRTAKPPISQVAVHTVSKVGQRLAGIAGTEQWAVADVVKKPPKDADFVLGGVVRLSDGRVRACVSVYPGASADPFAAIVGWRANGTADPAVGASDTTMPKPGWTRVPGLDDCGFASAGLQQLFVDGSDRLYVAGTASGVRPVATRVVRLKPSGAVDPAYGVKGAATIQAAARTYSPLTGAVAANGTLHLGLSSQDTAKGSAAVATVVKITPAGVRDQGFGSHGVSRFFPAGGSSELDSIGVVPGGRLVIGVVFTSAGARSGRLMAISAADGARVVDFGTQGTVVTKTLTWGMIVQAGYLLTIGNTVPADPKAYLGATVLQRRKL